jgi:hypothetical protein
VGDADDRGQWTPDTDTARFAGLLTQSERETESEGELSVTLSCLDYSTLFLEAKPFGTDGIPDFSQTLDEAWKRIVSQTPGAQFLADSLVLEGLDEFPLLGKAVASRFHKLAKVPTPPRTDAWHVWQTCTRMLGLISFFRLDKCVVTDAAAFYAREDPPLMIWGKNVKTMRERRNRLARKAIVMSSYNPNSGTHIEAFWPPVGDPTVKRKKLSPKKLGSPAAAAQAEERERFDCPFPTTDPKVLENVAKAVYEERSRQELQGSLSTVEMRVPTVSGKACDMLNLRNGDSVRVEFGQNDKETLAGMFQRGSSSGAMIGYLVGHGYAETLAEIMVANVAALSDLDSTFYVKRASTSLETTPEGVAFGVDIDYCNRITVTGDADKGAIQ